MDFAAARRNMIDGQILPNRVSDSLVIDAFENVPREQFVGDASRSVAYAEQSISVGADRFVLEPSVLARILQAAAIADTDKVLLVAGSTGYTAAVVASLAASVVLVDSDAELLAKAKVNLAALGLAKVSLVHGDLAVGSPAQGPYDVILIDGAVEHVPQSLLAQLSEGGRLVAVVQNGPQGVATVFQKYGASFGQTPVFDANIPKLTGFSTSPHFVF